MSKYVHPRDRLSEQIVVRLTTSERRLLDAMVVRQTSSITDLVRRLILGEALKTRVRPPARKRRGPGRPRKR